MPVDYTRKKLGGSFNVQKRDASAKPLEQSFSVKTFQKDPKYIRAAPSVQVLLYKHMVDEPQEASPSS